MIVIDASVLANAIADVGADGRTARTRLTEAQELAAPDLVDVETAAVLRRRWLAGDLTEARLSKAIADIEALDLIRYPALPLLRRAFELRANVTAYDAMYVALAEVLSCPLVTADGRLAATPTLLCDVEVLRSY